MTGKLPRRCRRSIRLPGYDYSQPGFYFITICAHKRKLLFGEIACGEISLNEASRIVKSVWEALPSRFPVVELDAFVIMPNHVHGIIQIVGDEVGAIHELPLPVPRTRRRDMLLPKVIGYFKMNSSRRINRVRGTPGVRVWQRNYYEHVIRSSEKLNDLRRYIGENPARWVEDRENPNRLGLGQ